VGSSPIIRSPTRLRLGIAERLQHHRAGCPGVAGRPVQRCPQPFRRGRSAGITRHATKPALAARATHPSLPGRGRRNEGAMNVARSLWASVKGDPVFMRRVNGWLTVFWLAMIPVSLATGWVTSVTYVSALSLWALVSGHWSAWQAARVEVNQEREEQRRDEQDIAGDVVDRMVEQTNVVASGDSAQAAAQA
jgi:hypothetical protein